MHPSTWSLVGHAAAATSLLFTTTAPVEPGGPPFEGRGIICIDKNAYRMHGIHRRADTDDPRAWTIAGIALPGRRPRPDLCSRQTLRHVAPRRTLCPTPMGAGTNGVGGLRRAIRGRLDFMVPKGVRFVPDNENLNFVSVLAFHRASQTLSTIG